MEEPGSRRQVEQWLDQLARRHQGRLLVDFPCFFLTILPKVFINPFSGTGRAERRWEQVQYLNGRLHLQMVSR